MCGMQICRVGARFAPGTFFSFSGIAVLNGLVMLSFITQLMKRDVRYAVCLARALHALWVRCLGTSAGELSSRVAVSARVGVCPRSSRKPGGSHRSPGET